MPLSLHAEGLANLVAFCFHAVFLCDRALFVRVVLAAGQALSVVHSDNSVAALAPLFHTV